ncbi:MAG: hypothetical protein AABY06_02590 [Nanoarchaeota archaeon]
MKDEDIGKAIITIGIILGGIWLGSEFIKAFSDNDKKDKGAGGNVDV